MRTKGGRNGGGAGARRAAGVLAALLVALAAACQPAGDAADVPPTAHAIRPVDLAALQLGKTAPEEVERRFGSPDRRDLDGGLVYFTTRRPSGGQDSVTFHFAGGALSRICTARAS